MRCWVIAELIHIQSILVLHTPKLTPEVPAGRASAVLETG